MAIIFFLFTMYFSSAAKSHHTKQLFRCEQNLQSIFVSLKIYATDSHDRFPFLAGAQTSEAPLSKLIPKYTASTELFICPGGRDSALPSAEPFANRRISYAYYMGHGLTDAANLPLMSDRQVSTKSKQAGDPLFSADGKNPANNHNVYGGNVMFCDGSVQSSPANAAFALTNVPEVVLLNPKP